MIIVAHRRNARSEIAATPVSQGAEIDIRSRGDDLILVHDAFKDGERFEDWLNDYRHRLLILNPKEDGLETRMLDACRDRGVGDLFLLDLPLPTMVRLARQGEHRLAVRVSEYEPIALALAFAGLAQWVWIDCFTRFPIGADEGRALKAAGFKLCVVSPELQGRWEDTEITAMRAHIANAGLAIDAVCTKRPEAWS